MENVKHVFFDLDKTLWDFETNSRAALLEIFELNKINQKGIDDFDSFYQTYAIINEQCWDLYRRNLMHKEYLRHQRFYLTLKQFNIDDRRLAKVIGAEYVVLSPSKTALMDGAVDVLEHLSKRFPLHIITNGFEEVQYQKMRNTGIDKYFKHVITSEKAGRRKPDPAIFRFALQRAGTQAQQSVMIGDDLDIDIKGAAVNGMRAIWYNPTSKQADVHHSPTITHLHTLCDLFP
ncbi:MAG: noncanonical pyrimidine nucleotidase, YjjG family [Candidatus Competibacteraceae bacterium]|nr:noncanonical pyrimidine nucleotidase, YjjG family [Candidatus Competibacteraceae bacterium]